MEGDVDGPNGTSDTEKKKCTNDECFDNNKDISDDQEQHMLHCNSCKRQVHLQCTQLPPYQLKRFLTFGKGFSPYICSKCVEVPDYLKKMNSQESLEEIKGKYDKALKIVLNFRSEVKTLKETLQRKDKELSEVKDKLQKVSDLNAPLTKQKQKKRRFNEEDASEEDSVIDRLRQQNESLNERLDERENALDEALQKLADIDCPTLESNENKILLSQIERSVQNKIEGMQDILISMINEKLESSTKNTDKKSTSWASVTTGETSSDLSNDNVQETHNRQITPVVQELRSIMMSTRNEEMAEQREKKERVCNIIIHGKEESDQQNGDRAFVSRMIQLVSVGIKPKSITRIGRDDTHRKRPIKVVFQTEQDKENILGNLSNLKGFDEFKGISVTEDYTITERNIVKEFTEKARERNNQEPEDSSYIWRVRGTPKNGLVLKRLMKKKPPQMA